MTIISHFTHPPSRDAVVTGMGFCLPGNGVPVRTPADLWEVASTGQTRLRQADIYHGSVSLSDDHFAALVPDVPGVFADHFTNAHRFGLVALAAAAEDAGFDIGAGDLTAAAVLAGRGGVDANVDSYRAVIDADAGAVDPAGAMSLFIGAQQAVTPGDVALVQSALLSSTGPCFTVSAGCSSTAVQVGTARRMIATGEVDVAVVTGVDVFNIDLVRSTQRLLKVAQRAVPDPALLPSFDRLMRPYDRRADCVNYGEGAAALILESRAHAEARGARGHGTVLAGAMTRDGGANPLASDDSGRGLVSAVRRCLGTRWAPTDVRYVHGGSDGDAVVTAFEVNAVTELYGDAVGGLLMTSQEGCFGHNGAPSGTLGVALTLLMLRHQQVCPTTNCEEPAPGIPFDPVPGDRSRPLSFDLALSLNYQIGGVKCALLLGADD